MRKRKLTLEQALEFFEAADDQYGYEHRAYPACIAELNGVVAIADDSGENGSSLEMHLTPDFIQWMTNAKHGLDSARYSDAGEAMGETRPDPAVADGH
jgi:hypothetical protein